MGQIPTATMIDRLTRENRSAYSFVAAMLVDGRWCLARLHTFIGSRPDNWIPAVWRYEPVLLLRWEHPARDLAVLSSVDEARLTVNDFEISLPRVGESTQFERRPSYSRYDRPPIPWPTEVFRINAPDLNISHLPQEFLIAPDAPSFADSTTAVRAFFEDDFSLIGAHSGSDFLSVRWAATEAYLGPIHITATEMTVKVLGECRPGTLLEWYSRSDRETRAVEGPGHVTFPLSDGLPEHTWLWLKRGHTWLDFRAIFAPWTTAEQLENAGVTIEAPVEPTSVVEALIAAGESPTVEFKSRVPTASNFRNALKTVAAFANSQGGVVIFGVDRDEVTIVGLDGENPTALRDRLGNIIQARVTPAPPFRVECHTIQGKQLLAVVVESGDNAPYGLAIERDKVEYYTRRGANTYPAQPDELRQAVLARINTSERRASNDWPAY